MGRRPVYLYRAAELTALPSLGERKGFTLRIDAPDYRVWLSLLQATVRVEEFEPSASPRWQIREEYPAE